jgi:hypothetical protein
MYPFGTRELALYGGAAGALEHFRIQARLSRKFALALALALGAVAENDALRGWVFGRRGGCGRRRRLRRPLWRVGGA